MLFSSQYASFILYLTFCDGAHISFSICLDAKSSTKTMVQLINNFAGSFERKIEVIVLL